MIKGVTKEEKSEKEGGQDKKIYRSVKEKMIKGKNTFFLSLWREIGVKIVKRT